MKGEAEGGKGLLWVAIKNVGAKEVFVRKKTALSEVRTVFC